VNGSLLQKRLKKSKEPHGLAMRPDNFAVGVPLNDEADVVYVNPKKCHDASAPKWQRFKKIQKKMRKYK